MGRNQPGDIVAFAHEHFAKLLQDRQSSEEALAKAQMIEKETAVLTPNADAIVPEKVETQEEEQLPNLNDFNNSDVDAVTKIQSGFRGMQARKQVKEMKEEAVVASPQEVQEVEDLPELNSFDNREVEAITKIQSGFRGMQARKQVAEMKNEQPENTTNQAVEELPDLKEFNNDEVNAITKIQSGFRGMQARKQVAEMKSGQTVENE